MSVLAKLGIGVLALAAALAGGCLSAPPKPDPAPAVSPDGQVKVAVERYRCTCGGEVDVHYHASVRARRARGKDAGTTLWVQSLDSGLDVFGETDVEGKIRVMIDGKPGEEVVIVDAPKRVRRFKLADGERVD